MRINFAKMHSLGNDFIVIDGITQKFNIIKNQLVKIADRRLGIGCDQVLIIEPPQDINVDISFKIFNSDGNEAMQCGNGARCIAKYAMEFGLIGKSKNLTIQNISGIINCTKINDYVYSVTLPNFTDQINDIKDLINIPELESANLINVGNNHVICVAHNLRALNIHKTLKKIFNACLNKNIQANISLIDVIDKDNIKANVFENGVGPTLACGSAACAITLMGYYKNLSNKKCRIKFKLGYTDVEILDDIKKIKLTGTAITTFCGEFKV